MDLKELLQNHSLTNFKNIINSKDRSITKLYNDPLKSLKLYTGKISEQYMVKNLDKYYSKLDIECWVLQLPYNMNNIKNDTHIHLLMKEGYLKNREKEKLAKLFLKINNTNFFFNKVIFLEYDEFFNFEITEYYLQYKNFYQIQYSSFNQFIINTYKIDCSNYIQIINDNINLNQYTNDVFKDYIECMKRNHYDDINTRIALFIYQDIFGMINDYLSQQIYLTNIDALVKDKNNEFALLELKSKTYNKYVYINENEYKLYNALLSSFKIVFYAMISLNEEDTNNLLVKRDIVYGDVEFYYCVLNENSTKYINITINGKGQKVAQIPLKFFNRIHTIDLDEMINNTINNYTTSLLKQSTSYSCIPINNYENELKKIMISEFKRVHIIHSLCNLKIENITYQKKGTSVFHILNSGKKIVTKYVSGRAWRISIDDSEIENYRNNNIDYILIVRLFKEDKCGSKIQIIGYISIEDYVKYATNCAKFDNIRSNDGFYNYCMLDQKSQMDFINQYGLTFVLSLTSYDYNRCQNVGIKINPYHPLTQLDENSVFDLGAI